MKRKEEMEREKKGKTREEEEERQGNVIVARKPGKRRSCRKRKSWISEVSFRKREETIDVSVADAGRRE